MPTTETTKVTVQEMRDKLRESGYGDEVDEMRKSELKEHYEKVQAAGSVLDSVVETPDDTSLIPQVIEDQETSEKPSPYLDHPSYSVYDTEASNGHKPTDVDWTDYVLTLFDKDKELENGNPRVDGLRRVAELLLGPCNITTDVVDAPRLDNAGRASVVVRLEFHRGLRIDGAADVYSGNTDAKFARHALATAETRAEGRALRKALKLSKVLSAEETYNAADDEATGNDGRIPSSMLNSLNLMCKRANVDLLKVALKLNFDINSADELTQKQGLIISEKLNEYGRSPETIPDEVKE